MTEYYTWKNDLLTSSPVGILVSKQIFKEEYLSIAWEEIALVAVEIILLNGVY